METGHINYLAEMVAKHLGITPIPTFGRWMKHSGHAKRRYYNRENVFTLAEWVVHENNFFRIYFVLHEVCHFANFGDGHGGKFRDAERKAMALFDLEPHYLYGRRYLDSITVLGTKVVVWSNATSRTKLSTERLSRYESDSLAQSGY